MDKFLIEYDKYRNIGYSGNMIRCSICKKYGFYDTYDIWTAFL